MVKYCCVKGCNVTTDEGIKFFKFPHNRVLRRKWIDTLRPISRTSIRKSFSAVICSQHFTPLDYIDVEGKIKLRQHVVPSVFNWDEINQPRIWNPKTKITSTPYGTTANNDDPTESISVMENVITGIIKRCTELVDNVWTNETNETEKNTEKLLENGKNEIVDITGDDKENVDEIDEVTCKDKENVDDSLNKSETFKEDDKPNDVIDNNGEIEKCIDETEKSNDTKNADGKNGNDVTENDKGSKEDDAKETSIKEVDITEPIKSDNDTDNATNDNTDDKITDLDALFMCEQQMTEQEFPLDAMDVFQNDDGNVTEHVQELCPDNIAMNMNEDSSSSQKNDLNKHDIEDILTNYFIPTLEGHADREEPAPERDKDDSGGKQEKQKETETAEVVDMTEEGDDPEFIEVPVDCDVLEGNASPRDCVMLLENVQVEVDPTLFPELGSHTQLKEDPISLLTSSDEDEVIIEEPQIDTVEVPDETDEDDVPLVKLLKRKGLKKQKSQKRQNIAEITWGINDHYCLQCKFTTPNRQEFMRHKLTHTKVIQVCSVCNYTTASEMQFMRHKRKHKEDRRFKCHICEYKARHNMSLIYHLKSHDVNVVSAKRVLKCDKCSFKCDVKGKMQKHMWWCKGSVKKYSCDRCSYETKRRSDMKRHKLRKHHVDADDPNWE